MATLSSGDTLSLNDLAGATGNTQNTNVSLGAIKGLPAANENIGLSEYAIDGVSTISGYGYLVEGTSETYDLNFDGEGSRFSQIKSRNANFTWNSKAPSLISHSSDSGYQGVFSGLALSNNEGATFALPNDGQTIVESYTYSSIKVAFNDGFNDHALKYNTEVSKSIYIVDSYDGNASALCLTADTPVILSDGSEIEIGDLEEGMQLKGYSLPELNSDESEEFEYVLLNSSTTEDITPTETEVEVISVVYSFAEKVYNINNGLLKATLEHPFLVKTNSNLTRFKRVSQLVVGDSLIRPDGSELEITSIDTETGTTEIVSIDVDGPNTYLANGFITHNKGGNTHVDYNKPDSPTLSWDSFNQILTISPAATNPKTDTGVTAYWIGVSGNDFASYYKIFDEYAPTEPDGVTAKLSLRGQGIVSGTHKVRVQAIESGKYGFSRDLSGINV